MINSSGITALGMKFGQRKMIVKNNHFESVSRPTLRHGVHELKIWQDEN